mgnify:CR=1 FL=1
MNTIYRLCTFLLIATFAMQAPLALALSSQCPEMQLQAQQHVVHIEKAQQQALHQQTQMPCHEMAVSPTEQTSDQQQDHQTQISDCGSCDCNDCHLTNSPSLLNQSSTVQPPHHSLVFSLLHKTHPSQILPGIDHPPKI